MFLERSQKVFQKNNIIRKKKSHFKWIKIKENTERQNTPTTYTQNVLILHTFFVLAERLIYFLFLKKRENYLRTYSFVFVTLPDTPHIWHLRDKQSPCVDCLHSSITHILEASCITDMQRRGGDSN